MTFSLHLTPKEQEFIDRLLSGSSLYQIADEMKVARRTVKQYIRSICHKWDIDYNLHHPSIRIAYLAAKQRGLIE